MTLHPVSLASEPADNPWTDPAYEATPPPAPASSAVREHDSQPGALAVVAHAFRAARRHAASMAAREGSWLGGVLAGHPPSVTGQRDYLRQRKWLPPGHDGGIADKAGEAYHIGIGVPGVALGDLIAALAARPFRAAWTLVVILVALPVAFALAGFGVGSGLFADAVLTGVVAAYLMIIAGLLAACRWRPAPKARPEGEDPE